MTNRNILHCLPPLSPFLSWCSWVYSSVGIGSQDCSNVERRSIGSFDNFSHFERYWSSQTRKHQTQLTFHCSRWRETWGWDWSRRCVRLSERRNLASKIDEKNLCWICSNTDKPRTAIVAELLGSGYHLSDQVVHKAIETDSRTSLLSSPPFSRFSFL